MQANSTERCAKIIDALQFEDSSLSQHAKARMPSRRGEPLFLANWERVLMIHFEVDAKQLQGDVPFQLDLLAGRAFVTLVAFTMHGMRPRVGGRLAARLFKPIATHEFLNVRTYVRYAGETGIHFLAEWLTNRLAVRLGPRTFGLPYRFGRIVYHHDWRRGELSGRVEDGATKMVFSYQTGDVHGTPFMPCERGSIDEWLMERYTAFNSAAGRRRLFRVWHPPWPQVPVDVSIIDDSLLASTWPWFKHAPLAGANFSPGLSGVWMGRPWDVDSGSKSILG